MNNGEKNRPIEQQIMDSLEVMADACARIKDGGGCVSDGCPIWGYACLDQDNFAECCDFLSVKGIQEFLYFAHEELEHWKYERMTEEERRYEYEAEQANLERSSSDD